MAPAASINNDNHSRNPFGHLAPGLAGLALLGLSVSTLATHGPPDVVAPEALIRGLTVEVETAVHGQQEDYRASPMLRFALLDRVTSPHTDYQSIGRWVLGKHWRTASEDQRGRFLIQFRALLLHTYAAAVIENVGAEINYFPVRFSREGTEATVRTEIPQPGGTVMSVDYRLRLDTGEWKVYDVVLEGVSLIAIYRAHFAQAIKGVGMEGLIEQLAEKNRQIDGFGYRPVFVGDGRAASH